ncbi:MAG: GNAT family N-acetyltransferase [Acidimicrobiales bacterium]
MGTADRWLTELPAGSIRATGVTLHRVRPDDLDELVDAVNASLGALRPWMPWAQAPATRQSIGEFLDQADRDWEGGREFQFAIRGRRGAEPEALIGCCGLHDRIGAGGLEIGYWVRSDCTGRGVATSAASALTASALGLDGVSRVEIHCDAANVRSAAIPPKLGFRLHRIEARPPISPGETDRHMIWVYPSSPPPASADLQQVDDEDEGVVGRDPRSG